MEKECLFVKLTGSVNNELLPKYSEIILELVGEPGGNPLRSGTVSVADQSIITEARILDSDESVLFTNQNARKFVINEATTDAEKALGTNKNTKIGLYPGNNVYIPNITEHIKEIPETFAYYIGGTTINVMVSNDFVDYLHPVFDLAKIKNLFKSKSLTGMTASSVVYGGSIEDLCIACSTAHEGNVPAFGFHFSINTDYNYVTFNGEEIVTGDYALNAIDGVIKIYDIVDHIGDDTYLKATYSNGTWTYEE